MQQQQPHTRRAASLAEATAIEEAMNGARLAVARENALTGKAAAQVYKYPRMSGMTTEQQQ